MYAAIKYACNVPVVCAASVGRCPAVIDQLKEQIVSNVADGCLLWFFVFNNNFCVCDDDDDADDGDDDDDIRIEQMKYDKCPL